MTIGLQAAVRALLAIGELLVIISGGIDLSVGTSMSLSMVTMGLFVINGHGSLEIGVMIAIATGFLIGLLNGTLVAFLELPPFIITLGTLGIAQGLALTFSSGFSMCGFPKQFEFIGGGENIGVFRCQSSSWPSSHLSPPSFFVKQNWDGTHMLSAAVKMPRAVPAYRCKAEGGHIRLLRLFSRNFGGRTLLAHQFGSPGHWPRIRAGCNRRCGDRRCEPFGWAR
jgi:Branched-chain amino acid transport system / permease component